jgi:hypothetical protein
MVGLIFVWTSLGAGPTNATATTSSTISPDERTALDQMARNDIAYMAGRLTSQPLLPNVLPIGYTFSHLMWDGNPNHGFNLFISTSKVARAIHLMEFRGSVKPGSKDTKVDFGSNLKPVVIHNTEWLAMQKADEPWKGSWIFVTDTRGFRLEVDGLAPRAVLEHFISSLG